MEMGEKIKKYRLIRHMTLEELGDRVGVGKSTVRKWENGMIANMRKDKVDKVAMALGVSAAFLMGWTDDPNGKVIDTSDEFTNLKGIKEKEQEPEVVYFDCHVDKDGIYSTARSNHADLDAEYQMLTIIYHALTKENRKKVVGIMQQMLISQGGGQNDD